MEEKYILISLDDERAEKIAEVIGNKSCKKILDYLSERESNETEISKELHMPLNTVDYNIKKLLKAGLIKEGSHWWSVKGKKIPLYKVSNKHIVISPKKMTPSKLKGILPLVLVSAVFSLFIWLYTKTSFFMAKTEEVFVEKAIPMLEATTSGADAVAGLNGVVGSAGFSLEIVDWFLIIIWALILLFVVVIIFRNERGSK